MPLYTVIGLDHPPHAMDRRDAVRTEHREYVLANDGPIRQVAVMLDDAGNQCGSMYFFEAESEAAIRDWLAREPFVATGVYEQVIIRRVMLGMSRIEPSDWPSRQAG
ncbi:MAG: hypothetical protein KGN34_01825 [Sphingomonadales bacterium]|nr:hypothetical protein [Sphingomonadales bacterium]